MKIIMALQKTELYGTYNDLKNGKSPDLVKNLGLFLDQKGIIRCSGRLGKAELPHDSKFPILLPRSHYVTQLIVIECHKRVMHVGTTQTLMEARKQYWITRGRSAIQHACKNVLSV